MLSAQSLPLIEATLPLVGERMPEIARNFYGRMLTAHPELFNGLFSRSNQKNGSQQQALAGSIAVFATHLVQNPETTPEAMLSRIAHKHVSLDIRPEQYDIVYKYLFEAIADELSDVVTAEIAGAWTEVYWLMAHALIKMESGLYSGLASDKPLAPWVVVKKEAAGTDAVTFTLEPADDTPVSPALPGQYVSVTVRMPDGIHQVRQYSLSAGTATTRVFTTKLDANGEVSPALHRDVQVGDTLILSVPCGDITLDRGDGPLVLASAGIGCTPSASILRSLVDGASKREVLVLHAESNLERWALRDQMSEDIALLEAAELELWLEIPSAGHHEGFMSLENVTIPDNASVYLCGPLPFMRSLRSQALAAGVPANRIHYEIFGPDLWLAGV
ncbi:MULTISPECIES: globin domain-containing protein [unclassified Cryobacterium]|uniref:globin domain-containing protein n=1 Tax=unclassified Cryobacterium TaxID=2649013 RepID=UPI002AB5728A|nr:MULTISPECIES: globin domain-containing protein [unclassified Cryobacterium]MDY7543755.1 globin domain-containing protein [Cryobacterium sp. 5B3]MEA9997561.1 globin domain-containing protein [Cryobacterium sp. RTS3]MEB0264274.1 globin domain-containing protein [Cryobacterium sp. 10I5]MEB0273456.1 globin domain-containing protein [Cryobacterium sp. 5B3]